MPCRPILTEYLESLALKLTSDTYMIEGACRQSQKGTCNLAKPAVVAEAPRSLGSKAWSNARPSFLTCFGRHIEIENTEGACAEALPFLLCFFDLPR